MHCQLPVTLLLSVASSPHALKRLLLLPAVASMRMFRFKLAPAMARVESIFSEAIPPPYLVLFTRTLTLIALIAQFQRQTSLPPPPTLGGNGTFNLKFRKQTLK